MATVAPLPTITDVFRCAFKWSSPDFPGNAVNVMHFRSPGKNPADVATALDSHVVANMWCHTSTHSKITEVDITPLGSTGVTFPFPTPVAARWAGTETVFEANAQVAVIVKLLTAERGRSHRGRVYLPWVNESVTTNGIFSAGNVTAMLAAWLAFQTAMVGDGHHLCIASYTLASSADVIATVVEKDTATQRRRNQRTSS